MKTVNSNLQKAGKETLTVLVIFFATCFTISAQGAGFENRFNDYKELASVETFKTANKVAKSNEASAELAYFAEFLAEESESDLRIELWMTDATYFGAAEMETKIEEVLEIEDWMLNEVLFKAEEKEKNPNEQVIINVDRKTKTIAVTFPGAQFGRRTLIHTEMEDPKLELEQWMVDKRVWLRKK